MSLIQRLERKYGRFAIPNVTSILIAGQMLLYVAVEMRNLNGGGISRDNLKLYPEKIVTGEIWRLVTFLFEPPSISLLFVLFYCMLFYLFGTTLEQHWGTFRYNLYLLIGYVANVAAAFLVWALIGPVMPADNLFLYGTVMLAFARVNPDFTLNLFFILPIRIKWLALLMWLGYGFTLLTGGWMDKFLVVASVLNYLMFFGQEHLRDLRQGQRRRSFQSKVKSVPKRITHQCRVCDLNSESSSKTLFRYCSKCAGQCCYCPEHIADHEHVKAEQEVAD
ncbi:MAG: rhomboid family intramembrane serine protease [Pirellulales bacterium]